MKKKKYTIEEIEKWLKGYLLFSEGKESKAYNISLNLAISQLRDDQDGIEAYTKFIDLHKVGDKFIL